MEPNTSGRKVTLGEYVLAGVCFYAGGCCVFFAACSFSNQSPSAYYKYTVVSYRDGVDPATSHFARIYTVKSQTGHVSTFSSIERRWPRELETGTTVESRKGVDGLLINGQVDTSPAAIARAQLGAALFCALVFVCALVLWLKKRAATRPI